MGVPPGSAQMQEITKQDIVDFGTKTKETTDEMKHLCAQIVAPVPFGQRKRFPVVAQNCGADRKAPGAKDADAAKLRNLSNDNSGRALILWYTIISKQDEKGVQTAALSERHTHNTQTLAAPRALRFRSASPERLTASHLC